MDLVRFQVAYWRVSSRGRKSGVGGRSLTDGRGTHTKTKHSKIPSDRSSPQLGLEMTDSDKSQNTHVP